MNILVGDSTKKSEFESLFVIKKTEMKSKSEMVFLRRHLAINNFLRLFVGFFKDCELTANCNCNFKFNCFPEGVTVVKKALK